MPVPVSPTKMSASDPKRIGGVWSFISRFNALVDWIISLSPSGATQYDTDWVSITPNPGYTAGENLAVRRVGTKVYLRGSITKTAGNFNINDGATDAVFTLPDGFRPSQTWRRNLSVVQATAGHGTALIFNTGPVVVTATGASTTTYRCYTDWLVG